MQAYEKLGLFYLGRPVSQDGGRTEQYLLYDSKDLVTHAICVGMTGSGKTGLCIDLLEEAAIDGVPSLVIDPKGDLGNLLLTFPVAVAPRSSGHGSTRTTRAATTSRPTSGRRRRQRPGRRASPSGTRTAIAFVV